MKCNFINFKSKDKSNINLSNKILQNIFYKKCIKSNLGKMIYKKTGNNKELKIFNKIFISKNKKRAKIIINNKLYELKENSENQKNFVQKIKIKFFDYILYSNCMFQDCESLVSVKNFQNINTNKLKEIHSLFEGCNSLLYIDDISNWNMNKINNNSSII